MPVVAGGERGERAMWAALVSLAFAGGAQCSRAHQDAPEGGPASSPFALQTPPVTSPAIALHNLDAEITDREQRAARGEPNAPAELVSFYMMRAKYAGRVADLVAADDRSAALVAARDGDARAHLTRAQALSAIHEFAAAEKELDRAAPARELAPEIDGAQTVLLLAEGRDEDAAALLPPVETGSPFNLALWAGVEARRDHAPESERLFERARAKYRDVSPFTVANMDFEHARALERGGDAIKARAYLTEAATVMPTYAHAVVHLASMEPPGQALARLEALEKTSDLPDVLGGEADALRRAGRAADATAMAARARARFEEVLARLPRAFADHAASFYLGVGRDPARALVLARANAENRATDEALELWLTAAQAADAHDETCSASRRVLGLAHATRELRERATVASKGCP